jgi:hypothetical protein
MLHFLIIPHIQTKSNRVCNFSRNFVVITCFRAITLSHDFFTNIYYCNKRRRIILYILYKEKQSLHRYIISEFGDFTIENVSQSNVIPMHAQGVK